MNPLVTLILLLAACACFAYMQRKTLSLRWLGIIFLCSFAVGGVMGQVSGLFPPLPEYMGPFIYGFIGGIAVLFANKFTGILLLKKILKENPGLVDKKGCFTYEGTAYGRSSGIGAEKPLALIAYFTINYPDGSSKTYPARFYIREGRLVRAALKKIPPAPYKSPGEDTSRENIREWKRYNGRLYAIANYQKSAP